MNITGSSWHQNKANTGRYSYIWIEVYTAYMFEWPGTQQTHIYNIHFQIILHFGVRDEFRVEEAHILH